MLQNTAILKVGGGLAAISGTAGAGYYAHTQGLFKSSNVTFENESEKNYLIVKTTEITATSTGELYDVGLFSSQKNFTCSATVSANTATTDDDCEIYKLSDEEKKLAKAITNNHSINAENIKKSGNYLKITSPKLIDSITKWEHTSDQLISVAQKTETTKLFGKLTPVYRVKNGEIVARKTSFLYAKVKDNVGTTISQTSTTIDATNKNYQCQLATAKFDCSIVELTLEATKKTINTSGNSAPTNSTLKEKDKHFKIEMEEKYLNNFLFGKTEQTIDLIEKNSATNKFATLTPLFKTLDKEISGKDNFLLLLMNTTENISGTGKSGYKKCKIGDSTKQIECDVYKFKSEQASTTDVSFQNGIEKTETNTDIKQNKHFLIKINKDVVDVNDLMLDTKIKLLTANAGDAEYTLTVKKRLFIDPTSDTDLSTVNTVHLLDI